MKAYLYVIVKKFDGKDYINELKLSEAHLINKILLLEGVKSVEVKRCEISKERYKTIFGA